MRVGFPLNFLTVGKSWLYACHSSANNSRFYFPLKDRKPTFGKIKGRVINLSPSQKMIRGLLNQLNCSFSKYTTWSFSSIYPCTGKQSHGKTVVWSWVTGAKICKNVLDIWINILLIVIANHIISWRSSILPKYKGSLVFLHSIVKRVTICSDFSDFKKSEINKCGSSPNCVDVIRTSTTGEFLV